MVIAVDIDNVLGLFLEGLTEFTKKELGYQLHSSDIKSNELTQAFNMDQDKVWDILFKFYESKPFNDLKVIPGSQKALSELSKDHKLISVTGRPESIRDKTETWLEAHFPGVFDSVHFINSHKEVGHKDRLNKSDYCKLHGADLIIDDDNRFANECAENGIKTIYFKTPYNQTDEQHENLLVANDWDHVLSIINDLV